MKRRDIRPIIEKIKKQLDSHRISDGVYSRYTADGKKTNPYGCADAINIMYTLGIIPKDENIIRKHIETLQKLQDKESGYFTENGGHHLIHTLAHCTAALDLLYAKPLYPFSALEKYKDINNVFSMLDGIDWLHCGKGAHSGAGLYAVFVITGEVDENWTTEYFNRLNESCDESSGLWISEPVKDFPKRLQIGDAFHYLFNYGFAKEPIPYPEALIDSCIAAYKNGDMGEAFGKQFHYIEVDWVYCLNRASHQTPHRFYEIKEIIRDFANNYLDFLEFSDWSKEEYADDLHLCFGVSCALAELQRALPGEFYSGEPLRLVLDKRPFI